MRASTRPGWAAAIRRCCSRPLQRRSSATSRRRSVDAARFAVRVRARGRRLHDRRPVSDVARRSASRRLHARQPARAALPDDAARRPDRRAAADVGRRPTRVVPQSRHRQSGRRRRGTRCRSGTATASAVTSPGRTRATIGARNRYDTKWTDFGTICERCHGPGAAHIGAPSPTGLPTARAEPLSYPPPSRPSDRRWCARSVIRCATSRFRVSRRAMTTSTHFTPILEYGQKSDSRDPAYWADGRPRRFSNDAIGFWQSRCFLDRRRDLLDAVMSIRTSRTSIAIRS